ncbi:alpha/beta fold hydrolase [Nocardia sp. NPDC004750]
MTTLSSEISLRRIATNGIEVNVAIAGRGPAVLLLHGFPHTWQLWSEVIGPLARGHRVIAPDLRGLGASTRAADGYDAGNLAVDAAGLLDALGEPTAAVVGIDAGTPPAFLLAMRHQHRVRRLVLMDRCWARCPAPRISCPPGRPGGSGSMRCPASRRRSSPETRRRISTGFWPRALWATVSPRRFGTLSSRPTATRRRCDARSPTTVRCRPAPGRYTTRWPPHGSRCRPWPSAHTRWVTRWPGNWLPLPMR